MEPEFEKRELNTASRNLDWNLRFRKVLVLPTVYSKVKWARWKLHPKELLNALDVPSDVQRKITGGIVHLFSCMGLPITGKIRTPILGVILKERL